MKKTTLILTILTGTGLVFDAVILGVCLTQILTGTADVQSWGNLILMVFSGFSLIGSIALSIPFYFIVRKEGFKNLRFYAYVHTAFILMSLVMIITGLLTA